MECGEDHGHYERASLFHEGAYEPEKSSVAKNGMIKRGRVRGSGGTASFALAGGGNQSFLTAALGEIWGRDPS